MEYLALGSGLPGFGRGFTCPVLLGIPVGLEMGFGEGAFTRCGLAFQPVPLPIPVPCPGPATPEGKPSGLDCCAFARHYSRNRFCFLLLQVLRCFTSLSVAPMGLSLFIPWRCPIKSTGFPHSEISGSMFTYNSPKHIVVCHVLLQLLVPRHPPCALSNLTTCLFPNLIEIFDLILLSLSLLVKKSYLHYLVFKELFLFEKFY